MAEGGYSPPANRRPMNFGKSGEKQIVCRYFLHGACARGDNCRFSHDKTRSSPADTVCRYYLAGSCVYGDRCRYDHVRNVERDKYVSQESIRQKENKQIIETVPERKSRMVKLKRGGVLGKISDDEEQRTFNGQSKPSELCATAKDFVPGQRFHGSGMGYADALQTAGGQDTSTNEVAWQNGGATSRSEPKVSDLLCPYFAHGHCPYEDECEYVHGDICEMCGFPRLHPTDQEQRLAHEKECVLEHENEMELAFLMQASAEKDCGICLERVIDKVGENGARADCRFGILENCNHCFCLSCIKEWRMKRSAEKVTHRSCPVCRTESSFVTPSQFWVDDPDTKKKLIDGYLTEIAKKPCQYFKQGQGKCPFGNSCFYLHALPDGTIAPPEPIRKPRRRYGADGQFSFSEEQLLWDFLLRRDESHRVQDLTADFSDELLNRASEVILVALEGQEHDDDDPELMMSIESEIRLLRFQRDRENSDSSDEDPSDSHH